MIFLAAALPDEAAPLIGRLELRRDPAETALRIYGGEGIRLVVTGAGKAAASSAVTHLLTSFRARREDILIHYGISALYRGGPDGRPAGPDAEPGFYLGRAIRDLASRRSFYPDLLRALPFPEAEILTVPFIYRRNDPENRPESWKLPFTRIGRTDGGAGAGVCPLLIDMEAAFVWEAASRFLFAHNILVLKIVSDEGDPDSVSRKRVKALVAEHADAIAELVRGLSGGHAAAADKDACLLAAHAADALKLSFYQTAELDRLAKHYAVRNGSLDGILDEAGLAEAAEACGLKQAANRREGKLVYAKIREKLLEP